ncbi:MAG: hypothetical protein ABJA83_10310 [Burkholderiaceae bacterium]
MGLLFLVAWGLIDRREIVRIGYEERDRGWPLLVTFFATITLQLEWAVVLGITGGGTGATICGAKKGIDESDSDDSARRA